MPITTRLSRTLHQTLGEEAAEDLVNWMQQVELQRAELRELNELNFSRFDARLGETRAELRQEMQAGFGRLENKLEQRTADLMKWSFVFWIGAVGAVAALAGVLR